MNASKVTVWPGSSQLHGPGAVEVRKPIERLGKVIGEEVPTNIGEPAAEVDFVEQVAHDPSSGNLRAS